VSLIATARSVPGTLRQDVRVAGEHELVTDQPITAGGEGLGPSPHELFPAALAACVAVTLTTYARTKQWEIGEVTVDVDYDHRSTPRRCEITITLTGDVTPVQLERLAKVAAACPLRRSIEAGIVFDEHIAAATVAAGEHRPQDGDASIVMQRR
jgi:putative redox protein